MKELGEESAEKCATRSIKIEPSRPTSLRFKIRLTRSGNFHDMRALPQKGKQSSFYARIPSSIRPSPLPGGTQSKVAPRRAKARFACSKREGMVRKEADRYSTTL
jgi:hypothetical protein